MTTGAAIRPSLIRLLLGESLGPSDAATAALNRQMTFKLIHHRSAAPVASALNSHYDIPMPDDLYDRDVLAWSEYQADLLRRLARGERVNG
jgi:hypothetical protein